MLRPLPIWHKEAGEEEKDPFAIHWDEVVPTNRLCFLTSTCLQFGSSALMS